MPQRCGGPAAVVRIMQVLDEEGLRPAGVVVALIPLASLLDQDGDRRGRRSPDLARPLEWHANISTTSLPSAADVKMRPCRCQNSNPVSFGSLVLSAAIAVGASEARLAQAADPHPAKAEVKAKAEDKPAKTKGVDGRAGAKEVTVRAR